MKRHRTRVQESKCVVEYKKRLIKSDKYGVLQSSKDHQLVKNNSHDGSQDDDYISENSKCPLADEHYTGTN